MDFKIMNDLTINFHLSQINYWRFRKDWVDSDLMISFTDYLVENHSDLISQAEYDLYSDYYSITFKSDLSKTLFLLSQ